MTEDQRSMQQENLPTLSPKQIQTLVAIMTTRTDAEAIEKSPYSMTYFYEIKPKLMKYKQWYLEKQLEKATTILQEATPDAAEVLAKQLKETNKNEVLKNKAANDVLDRVGLTKNKGTAVKVDNDGQTTTVQVISYGN